MAVTYSELSQSENDDDSHARPSPSASASLSPAPSTSPMPFLHGVESTFTPLSMNSEGFLGDIRQKGEDEEECRADLGVVNLGQSLSSARDTRQSTQSHANKLSRVSHNDRGPSYSSSPGSGLGPVDTSAHSKLDQGRSSLLDVNSYTYTPNESNHENAKSATATSSDGSADANPKVVAPPQQVPQQPPLVRPTPIVRTASTKSVSLRHPTPDNHPRSSSHASNIAQLEATAQRLSMTSSIDEAIRDLHDEQKRNDSRRSSILAASIASIPEAAEPTPFPVTRQLSAGSSILETNNAARFGGYSPAGYVMSPNHSLLSSTTRRRAGSTGLPKADSEADKPLTRHGPEKSSVRSSVSVSRPTLTDIAEMEPTALTSAAMDEADRLEEEPEEEDEPMLRIPQMKDIDLTPNANPYDVGDYWHQGMPPPPRAQHQHRDHDEERPPTAGSGGTFEQAERAFADFDGAHCSPYDDFEDSYDFPSFFASPTVEMPFPPPFHPEVSLEDDIPIPAEAAPPARRSGLLHARPKSYIDPETGQNMMFYPARVPMMLNLPQKLSKKPKAEVRNTRKSQVLNAMPQANRQSGAPWLGEMLPERLLDPLGSNSDLSTPRLPPDTDPILQMTPPDEIPQSQLEPEGQGVTNEARKSRMSLLDPEKRKSRLPALGDLPPQLRASAFFDLPSESPAVQLKDGSAMATLDSILDASVKAPVSAFTDHAFVGSLGLEVYGTERKRKSHLKHPSVSDTLGTKKRSSIFHLRKPSSLSQHSTTNNDQRRSVAGIESRESLGLGQGHNEERQRLSASVDGEQVRQEEEEEEEEEEANEEDPVYNGPPTTLLAELQIRKQQNKLRTRPAGHAYPNGMHSTLLEMDAVAELERKARRGKKINLAWEDPSAKPAEESDDEDVPLALLAATKGQKTDISTAMAEIHRPLGLMERREIEDNEPLSARRDRLQGREPVPLKRQTLGQGLQMSGGLGPSGPQLRIHTPEEEEVETETLGERMRRLKSREQEGVNTLPKARPVSSAFSAELLSQLGDTFQDEENKEKARSRKPTPANEEEETLGQRRRRLQAEREAREREISAGSGAAASIGAAPKLTKRHSLADVLSAAHGSRTVLSDPRREAEKAKQQEAIRYRQEQDQKLAALRNQTPATLSPPNLTRAGGYLSGRFNDGATGGTMNPLRGESVVMMPAAAAGNSTYGGLVTPTALTSNGIMAPGAVPGYGVPTATAYGAPMTTVGTNMYGAPVQMPTQPAIKMDRVENWRRNVFP